VYWTPRKAKKTFKTGELFFMYSNLNFQDLSEWLSTSLIVLCKNISSVVNAVGLLVFSKSISRVVNKLDCVS
jgi:hypothetical protein